MKKIGLILCCLFLLVSCGKKQEVKPEQEDEKMKIEELEINNDIWLLEGDSEELYFTISPSDYQIENLKWSTSDEEIACVTDNIFYAKKEGDCILTLEIDGISVEKKVSVRHSDYFIENVLPENRIGLTYVDGILIANKTYSLPEDYNPKDLLDPVYTAFDAMKERAKEDDVDLFIVSGFRSYDYQKGLYQRYVDRDGKEKADTYSARAGHSEHQTGLAMDINDLNYSFGETKEGKWVKEHCADFGFIIRYPKGKEDITGYHYEPWHLRFVGTVLAKKVTESGLCLEEYLDIDSVYQD